MAKKLEHHAGPAPRGWDRRGLLITIGAAGGLFLVFMYAGPSWLIVLHQLLTDGAFLLAWLLSAAGWGAIVLLPIGLSVRGSASSFPATPGEGRGEGFGSEISNSRFQKSDQADPHPDPLPEYRERGKTPEALLRFVTAAAIGLGMMSLATLGLGLAGWLNRGAAFGMVAGGLLVGAVIIWRRWGAALRGDIGRPLREWLAQPAGWSWLWLVVLPLLAAALVAACVPPGVLWSPDEPHGYDVVEYHFQIPREWYEAGRVFPLEHNVFSYFPFAVEMHYLLAMLLRGGPWAGMYLAQLMHVAYVALAVLAVYSLACSFARTRAVATAAPLAAAAVPWLTLLAPVGYNEGGLLLYGTMAIGGALRGIGAPPRVALARFGVAGAMAGFACGVKLTAVPMLLAALPLAVVLASPRSWKHAAVLVVIGGLLFAPWAARNFAWAGNPVFPEGARLLGQAHFSDVQVERWERAHAPRADQRSAGSRLAAFGREVVADWRFGYFVPLGFGVLGAVVGFRDRRARALAVLLVLLTLFWLGLTHLQGRFFVLAVPVVALLIAVADWGRWWPAVVMGMGAAALASALLVHGELSQRLHGNGGLSGVLGAEDLSGLSPPEVAGLPPEAPLVLVGEARAFWYTRPMRVLRYRTVFDVDAGEGADVVAAWRGQTPRADEWVLINPSELQRFADTYRGIPQPPAGLKGKVEAVLVPPGR